MTLVDYLNTQDLAKRPSHLPNAPAGTIIGMASGVPQDVAPLVSAAAPTYSGALNNGLVSPSLPLQNPVNSELPNIPQVTQPSFADIANAKMLTVSNSVELPNSVKVDAGNANIEKVIEPSFKPGNINADAMGSAYLNGQGVAYSTGNEDLGGGVEIDNDGYVVINGVRSEYKVTKNEGTSTETPKMDFEQWYENTKKNAETDRQKAVVNARNNYEHSLSAYGSNAAKLGNMGLAGSGYTDYLDSQAYAQMRADQNAAAATKAATIADADAKYVQYLDEKETSKSNAYANMMTNIGSYTTTQIDSLGKQLGFSDPQIAELKAARKSYKTENSVSNIINNISNYSVETINRLAKSEGFTDDQKTAIKETRLEYAKDILANGDYDKRMLDKLFDTTDAEEKALYTEYYNKIKNDTQNYLNTMTAESFKDMNAAEVLAMINAYKNSGLELDVSNAEAAYNAAYKLDTNDSVTLFKEKGGGDSGDKIKVKVDGKKYTLEYEGDEILVTSLTKDQTRKDIAAAIKNANLPENTVFLYDGVMYVVTGRYDVGTVAYRKITKTGNKNDSYNTVKDKLKEKTTKE